MWRYGKTVWRHHMCNITYLYIQRESRREREYLYACLGARHARGFTRCGHMRDIAFALVRVFSSVSTSIITTIYRFGAEGWPFFFIFPSVMVWCMSSFCVVYSVRQKQSIVQSSMLDITAFVVVWRCPLICSSVLLTDSLWFDWRKCDTFIILPIRINMFCICHPLYF